MLLFPPKVIAHILKDDGIFPNNNLALLIYKHAIDAPGHDLTGAIEQIFMDNGWGGMWRNGIYTYQHYHSTAHEVLGIYSGKVKAQLGGSEGIIVEAGAGDVIIIPAGVAHKNLGSSADFRCIGAYPPGQTWDMNYGKPGERPATDRNIANVALPRTDPVYGPDGPLIKNWW
jgi:uncharacterized protein YjlB